MDKILLKALNDEKERQKHNIELIASENFVSDDILKLIDNTDTPDDILDDFTSTFIEETTKWKLEHDNTTR